MDFIEKLNKDIQLAKINGDISLTGLLVAKGLYEEFLEQEKKKKVESIEWFNLRFAPRTHEIYKLPDDCEEYDHDA